MGTKSSTIAVTGATGRVGRHVVDILEERGHRVVPIARSVGVDVVTGEGLDAALGGVDVIVDTATSPSPDKESAAEFFATASHNLQTIGAKAGVKRIVAVSIIGIEQFDVGYNAAKNVQEEALRAGPLPVHILRAAQFHEFVEQLLEWCTQGDVAYMPEMRTQLVAARSVAERLVALAEDEPGAGEPVITEIAGPREESLPAVTKVLVDRQGSGLRVQAVSDSDDELLRLYASGALLPNEGAELAGPTFEEWLDAMVPGGSLSPSA